MDERFDRFMKDFAEEADREVDYQGLKAAILKKAAEEKKEEAALRQSPQKEKKAPLDLSARKHKKRARLFKNLSVAAALVLLAGGSGYVAGQGGFAMKAETEALGAAVSMAGESSGATPESARAENASVLRSAKAASFDAQGEEEFKAEAPRLTLDMSQAEVPTTTEATMTAAAPAAMEEGATGAASYSLESDEAMPRAEEEEALEPEAASEESVPLTAYRDYMFRQYYTMLVNPTHLVDEDYEPVSLVNIREYRHSRNYSLKHTNMYGDVFAVTALDAMMEAAKEDGVKDFYIVSVYRDYDYQSELWAAKVEKDPTYGEDPSVPVVTARPGTSEHQTGLAFDITCEEQSSMGEAFGETVQGKWLAANSYRYGFILRYQKGKEHLTGVVYEPWHFRYVGVELATYLYENDLVLEEFYEGM